MAVPVPGPAASASRPAYPRTAIVTGGDRGIGKATALALAAAGFDVGFTWHDSPSGADETAAAVEALGRRAHSMWLDTTDLPSCAPAVEQLAGSLGSLGVFVNNVGVGLTRSVVDTDYEDWKRILDTNLNGAFLCLQAAAKLLLAGGAGGRIVVVTSIHAKQPRFGYGAYCASKFGLDGLTKTLAVELSEHGITVNAVAPGEIATHLPASETRHPHAIPRPGIPLGHAGTADEIADVITFLASPAASYVTGASWAVDGGMGPVGAQASSHLSNNEWRAASVKGTSLEQK
nr:SDR family oxidoreductase [Arthrobacter sp. PAMC 25486]